MPQVTIGKLVTGFINGFRPEFKERISFYGRQDKLKCKEVDDKPVRSVW